MMRDRRTGRARPLVAAAFVAAWLLALAGAAVAESPGPGASAGPAGGNGTAISIVGTTFEPTDVTIHVGDTVTWTVTQATSASHSVTSGSPSDTKPGTVFDSGIRLRNNGDSFSHTFDTAGTFPFFCAVHPDTMRGTVTVEASPGGGQSQAAPTDASSKLVAAGILGVALIVLFAWARLYRRMNPAP